MNIIKLNTEEVVIEADERYFRSTEVDLLGDVP
jgi:GDP-D-mannose dehydratase